ncbi:hypothetical protein BJ322DRAFT_737992 [Thelephora terrestris]|uniref:Protein kinase domain-containing protein n=1 Tax=Thelephora terrestris TaxID=56493 RepID=A0A9P6HGV9_9AGAM|nr:hypothetical protein BJ322DRAFT_737992 [Thelephora terrestris]
MEINIKHQRFNFPEAYGMDKIIITKESDVYGMAMVIYEALTEKKPYHNCSDSSILPKAQAGETPERPPDKIDDSVWVLLQGCWSRDPANRPPIGDVYSALLGRAQGQLLIAGLPAKLMLQFQGIKLSPNQSKRQSFYVKLRYGKKDHTTSPTNCVYSSGEHAWTNVESWPIDTNKQHHGQSFFVKVLIRNLFTKDKIRTSGKFTLSADKVDKVTSVKLEALEKTEPVVVRVLLIQM